MSENTSDGLRIDQFGAEAQRQLASVIVTAVKREKRGRGRPSEPYVKKDRAFVAKELVYLHFKRELPWKKSIQFLRTRSDYKTKMSGIKDESWIIYALDFRKKHM